ncbi:ATP-dependent helicase [Microbulbifer litoralis]|uniref:ATP-dependent helicase n=1 Tax=Microbulbifer litoralis TaxID=2933965 RepID=UPI0020295C9C|nr:ATP-dependent helicase [Microbulbifer sp. GX H0434]
MALAKALTDLEGNTEQHHAVHERGHCVVLAGPGSGKTKTLTTAMARTLMEDVVEPRGVACITYNNECAMELETRLAKLGITSSDRSFIGTVHSFALTQVITPYARCIPGLLPSDFRIATRDECRVAVEDAYGTVFDDVDDPHRRWRFAVHKRLTEVDRNLPYWRERNPDLADFIEAYEAELRSKGLIDFDDMPLIAFRMIKEHSWIRDALRARFPVLFVDEYQDLGYALHELVLLLCFDGGVRLFAVGDVDQSIYGFAGANPALLQSLTDQDGVEVIRLRFNYRSGTQIIRASMGALGEERDYHGIDNTIDGEITYWPVQGNLDQQAQHIAEIVLPTLLNRSFQPEQIAILYRTAPRFGDKIAGALECTDTAFVRADSKALVRRSSRLARFIEACASWVTGGWREADPPYRRLLTQALNIVYGRRASEEEERALSHQLIVFLRSSIGVGESTHTWLQRFLHELIETWRVIAHNTHQEWEVCSEMIERTDPAHDLDMPLSMFSGRTEHTGRVTLSTLHSAKGREFDAVILFGINNGDLPSWHDNQSSQSMREARRLFYVGVTRARRELCLVYREGHQSPWLAELYQRSQQS